MAIFTSQKFHAGEKILNSKFFTDSMVLRTTSHIFLADMFKQYQLASLGTIHPCSNYSVKTACMEISTTEYPPLSTTKYPFMQLSYLEQCQVDGVAQDSTPQQEYSKQETRSFESLLLKLLSQVLGVIL